MSSALSAAVKARRIPVSPWSGIRLPPVEGNEVVPLTGDEITAMRKAIHPWLAAIVPVGAMSGLRPGELLGLRVPRVLGLGGSGPGVIEVREQLQSDNDGGNPTLGPLKTSSSRRDVPVPTAVLDIIEAHIDAHGTGPDGLVFATSQGRPTSRRTLGHAWRTAAKQVGVTATPHALGTRMRAP